jgi:hypothetical protein
MLIPQWILPSTPSEWLIVLPADLSRSLSSHHQAASQGLLLEMLEPHEGKLSRTFLRGKKGAERPLAYSLGSHRIYSHP